MKYDSALKNKTVSVSAEWTQLHYMILSQVNKNSERQILHAFLYMLMLKLKEINKKKNKELSV